MTAVPRSEALTDSLTEESTETDLWAQIWRYRAAVKGPKGYATWQDAATDERAKRAAAERKLAALSQTATPQSAEPPVEALHKLVAKWKHPNFMYTPACALIPQLEALLETESWKLPAA